MERRWAPLRPALAQSAPASAPPTDNIIINSNNNKPRQKRRQVAAACSNCRRRKEKCDDKRPTCSACAKRGVPCNNDSKNDDAGSALAALTTLTTLTTLKSRNAALLHENEQLRHLFVALRTASPSRGQDMLARLRAADDPLHALRAIQRVTSPLSSSLASSSSPPSSPDMRLDARLERLELLALRESSIRVDARPWTAVAGDGLVSEY
ncbi:hypothetical protein E4U43_004516, partial [Claviceps pusilla]